MKKIIKQFNVFRACCLLTALFIILSSHPSLAQPTGNGELKDLSSKAKKNAITSIIKLLNDNYVYPETAKKTEKYLLSKLKKNEYDDINNPIDFGEALTKDLQSVSKDKHLRVNYNPEAADIISKRKPNADETEEKDVQEMMKYQNYGFEKVERLNGNIGYIDFRNFAPSKLSKETVASVMGFISNTDAVIIDLRQNGGGDPTGVQLICSYFFDATPVHLNDIYYRPENKTEEYWTLGDIEGKRMPNINLYILTSKYTFSGAEEFAYDLKNLNRATIIGETTGGGAHPGDMKAVDKNFVIFLPMGRAINPVTKTNWEGVGVAPDIEISSEKALETAEIMALEKIKTVKANPEIKKDLDSKIEILKAELNPVTLDETALKSYPGNYEDRTISIDNGKLYYQRAGRPKLQMIPLSGDTFGFKELGFFKLKFEKDSKGNVISVTGIYSDGHNDSSKKN